MEWLDLVGDARERLCIIVVDWIAGWADSGGARYRHAALVGMDEDWRCQAQVCFRPDFAA